jgi:asparagine synthase (glutamine-hydrolysing)
MCGIVGVFRTGESSHRIDADTLALMRDTMSHRGPDDQGIFISPGQEVGLAFRRLAIIDLSHAACQPMSTDDESLWIVFNGEIYNHAELRKELESLGRKFRTDHSDTEVILKGYEQWGEDVLARLRGMFAFAIWDKKKSRLWMARDRVGIKPLFFTRVAGLFIFASEIKALLAFPGVRRQMNERAFYDFLTFLVPPAPDTLFEGVQKLPAAHTVTIMADGRHLQRRYWNPFTGVRKIEQRPEEEWHGRVLAGLRESVQAHMVSDVKVGAFLSDGIDSAASVALMAEKGDRPLETFSIGFESGGNVREPEFARTLSQRHGTSHHASVLERKDLLSFLSRMVANQEEPVVDPACVPVYHLAKLARENGTAVCQSGEGADELFCGQSKWGMNLSAAPLVSAYQYIPGFIRKGAWTLADLLTPPVSAHMRGLELARRASYDEPVFWGGAEAYLETTKRRILSLTFRRRLQGHSSVEPILTLREDFENDRPDGSDELHWMSYLDLRLRLPEQVLMRTDKMTMAHSIEARVPFLDHEFVRLAMGIPASLKYRKRRLNHLLKAALRGLLPDDLLNRKKAGFALPVSEWFTENFRTWARDTILRFSERTDYFHPQRLADHLDRGAGKRFWFLLNFVLWHERWIENKTPSIPGA